MVIFGDSIATLEEMSKDHLKLRQDNPTPTKRNGKITVSSKIIHAFIIIRALEVIRVKKLIPKAVL